MFIATVVIRTPRRLSQLNETQFFPARATIAPPLYVKAIIQEFIKKRFKILNCSD